MGIGCSLRDEVGAEPDVGAAFGGHEQQERGLRQQILHVEAHQTLCAVSRHHVSAVAQAPRQRAHLACGCSAALGGSAFHQAKESGLG